MLDKAQGQKGATAKTPSATEQLDRAREDLTVAVRAVSDLAHAETLARATSENYASWRAERDALNVEIERLTVIIAELEAPAARERELSAADILRKRHAAKQKENAELAVRIRNELAKANAILLSLFREVATSAAEDQKINAKLPDDLEPLMPADSIARGRPALPREELGREKVWLWTKSGSGVLIGDQDAVEDRGNGLGILPYEQPMPCIKTMFENISYHPAETMERPVPIWQLKLPYPDGPGFAFDGSRCQQPVEVLAELERGSRVKVRERPVEVRVVPIPSDSN